MSLPVVIRITTFLLLTLGPVVANGEPAFEIVPDSKAFGCSQIYPFKEDNLKIVLRDGNKILAEQFFCSSYGLADATIEKDAKGNYFLLLRYGEGRGTNARSEFLNVYKVSDSLIEYVRIPVSAPSGPVSGWSFEYSVSKPKSGGLVIALSLRIAGQSAELVPREKQRTIEVR